MENRRGRRGEVGQVAPLILMVVVVLTLVLLGVARLGAAADDVAKAHLAADMAALAGAADGRAGAVRIATLNGARLVRFRSTGHDAIVTVTVRGVRATARARASARPAGSG